MNGLWAFVVAFSGLWCVVTIVWGVAESSWRVGMQIATTLWVIAGAGGAAIKIWRGEL